MVFFDYYHHLSEDKFVFFALKDFIFLKLFNQKSLFIKSFMPFIKIFKLGKHQSVDHRVKSDSTSHKEYCH